jgi:hypothetical protein
MAGSYDTGWACLNKKDKLLFSFVTNTVKMLCFLGPGQRIVCVRPVSVVGFAWFDMASTGKAR